MRQHPITPTKPRFASRRLRLEQLEERQLLAVCDPNGDGDVDRDDVVLITTQYSSDSGAEGTRGDCNSDSKVNVLDLHLLQVWFGRGRFDFGDLPSSYGTMLANNGARHQMSSNLSLGAAIDVDADGQPSANAQADDTDSDGDDEDGVFFLTAPTPGAAQRVRVDASAGGMLDAWIDFSRDGDFDDAGEQIFSSKAVVAGSNNLSYFVAAGTPTDPERPTYARFRLSSAGGLAPSGPANDGEVEDYALFIHDPATIPAMTVVQQLWDWELQWEEVGDPGDGPSALVMAEAAGPAEFRVGPAVHTDNGQVAEFFNPGSLPFDGSWYVPHEMLQMRLTGVARKSTGNAVAIESLEIVHEGLVEGDASGNTYYIATAGGGVWKTTDGSTFDVPFRINFANGMSLMPQGGTLRLLADDEPDPEPKPVPRYHLENAWPLVDVDTPHMIWDYLRSATAQTPQLDWGDAPDRPYPTLAASNGAAHVIRPGYSLGATIDAEPNGQPSPLATRDDTTGIPDDEDGVAFTSVIVPGGTAKVGVTATGGGGYLNAWLDANRDGDWDDPGEQIFTSTLLSVGFNSLTFAVPATAITDSTQPTPTRWRYSRQAVLGPRGLSSSGEVEDHAVFVLPANAVPPPVVVQTLWDWEMDLESAEAVPAEFRVESTGPAEFRVGPAVNMENGMPFDLGGPDTLPPGMWHVNTEILEMILTGALFEQPCGCPNPPPPPPPPDYLRIILLSPGEITLKSLADGSWDVDSYFDISYRIDLPESSMSLLPQGGSTRIVNQGRIDRATPLLHAVLTRNEVAETDVGQPLVDAANPQMIWDYLRGLRTQAPPLDWGDAPDPRYPTLAASNGAAHVVRQNYSLGATVDDEPDGQPSPLATRDDTTGIPDDEDGVAFTSPIVPGGVATVDVTATGGVGYLNAWTDFNRDGDWDDAGEQIFTSTLLSVGVNSLTFAVPVTALASSTAPTPTRWRLSRQAVLGPRGLSSSGEVEDHAVFVLPATAIPAPLVITVPDWDWQLDAETVATATAPAKPVVFEATGPATFRLGPAVNTENGMVFDLDGPGTLPPGTWHVDTELLNMNLAGTLHETQSSTAAPLPVQIVLPDQPNSAPDDDWIIVCDPDGTCWIFFSLTTAFRIDMPDGTSLVPAGGSLRLEHSGPLPAGPLSSGDLVLWQANFGQPANNQFGELLVIDSQLPQETWGNVRGLRTQIPQLDWGDAPDRPYPTLAASNGAAHVIRPGYSLGATVDAEADGQPGALATRDDTTGIPDDEDGVIIVSSPSPGGAAVVNVTATDGRGYLNAWADFNRNGAWEPGEQIFTSQFLNVGANTLSFTVPPATLSDATSLPPVMSRWRFSRQAVLSPTGLSSSGEVEDHHLRIDRGPASSPAAPAAVVVVPQRADAAFAESDRRWLGGVRRVPIHATQPRFLGDEGSAVSERPGLTASVSRRSRMVRVNRVHQPIDSLGLALDLP